MRLLISIIIIIGFASISFAGAGKSIVDPKGLMQYEGELEKVDKRLEEMIAPQGTLERIEKQRLEMRKHQLMEMIKERDRRIAYYDELEKQQNIKKEQEKTRFASLTPEQQTRELTDKENAKQLVLKKKMEAKAGVVSFEIRTKIKQIFDEGTRQVDSTKCLASIDRQKRAAGQEVRPWFGFGARTMLLTCEKYVQHGYAKVNCSTCVGNFTISNTQYQSLEGGVIARAIHTGDDGLIYDMSMERIKVSWPQSGHYLVFDVSDNKRVKVVEVNSYIAENMVKSYLGPKERVNFNINNFFRKIDYLFQQSELSVEEFSKLVFNPDWLENQLKKIQQI